VGDQDRRELIIECIERNGPATSPPARRGFDTQLLKRLLNNQIGARAMISYKQEGLRAHIAVPLPCRMSAPTPMDSLAPLGPPHTAVAFPGFSDGRLRVYVHCWV
jgi:hypothetical protein